MERLRAKAAQWDDAAQVDADAAAALQRLQAEYEAQPERFRLEREALGRRLGEAVGVRTATSRFFRECDAAKNELERLLG